MSDTQSLKDLYKNVLPNIEGRIWKKGTFNTLNYWQEHIDLYNQIVRRERALYANPQTLEDEPALKIYHNPKVNEARKTIENLRRELGPFKPGVQYRPQDMYGKTCESRVPETTAEEPLLTIVMSSYLDVAKSSAAKASGKGDLDPLWTIKPRRVLEHEKLRPCSVDYPLYSNLASYWFSNWIDEDDVPEGDAKKLIEIRGQLVSIDKAWEMLTEEGLEAVIKLKKVWVTVRRQLESLLEKHADYLQDVTQVICFGLGALHSTRCKTYAQHLAAVTIRDTLQRIQRARGVERDILLVAQDPQYCSSCEKNLPEFDIVTDLTGFLKLTKDTFVVTVAPGAPVCEIVADVLKDEGGPAAMLCNTFSNDYLCYPDTDYTTDEPTENLVDFKKRCVMEDFDDSQTVLGMSYDAFVKDYTFPAKLRKQYVDSGLDKDKIDTWPDDKRQKFLECSRLWKLEGEINFRNTSVYIKTS